MKPEDRRDRLRLRRSVWASELERTFALFRIRYALDDLEEARKTERASNDAQAQPVAKTQKR